MVFSSTVFLFLFLPVLLVLYYIPYKQSARRTYRNMILLVFSIGFYAWGEPGFVFVMLVSILVNWLIAIKIESSVYKKTYLVAGIVFDVLLLGIFKYATFVLKNIALITGNNSLVVDIALPIGISFFTFQLMSYLFDIYYGNATAQKNPLYTGLYIALFPQLIAGPIVRYKQIEHEILERKESFAEIAEGFQRFVYGLGKKVLLANFLAQVADNSFDHLTSPSVMSAWLGAIAYTLQIYFDFSGYSDMAIGLGRMFGFHLPENFNYPYIASSVTDFWRRWHITLGSWFRDYVYIPLGGNRVSKKRWIFNLFIVWLLTGIWHGANWTFVLWGLLFFVVLLFEKRTGLSNSESVLSHVYTLLIVVLTCVIFRSSDVLSAGRYIGCMFGISAGSFTDAAFLAYIKGTYVVLILALIGMTPGISKLFDFLRNKGFCWIEPVYLLLVFFLSILEVISSTYNPFIYFNF